jgi:anti-anti-sigma factor
MLTLQLSSQSDFLLIKADGRLDALGAGIFEQETNKQEATSVFWVLDCSGLVFLSSAGIRALVLSLKKLHKLEGALILLNPGEQMRQVLDMSGLIRQFSIAESLPEAAGIVGEILARHQGPRNFESNERRFSLKALPGKGSTIKKWKADLAGNKPLLVSLKELGMAFGKGSFAEDSLQALELTGAFFSFPGFFYFSPEKENIPSDYFSGKTDAAHGVYINEAFSVNDEPAFMVDINTRSEAMLSTVAGEICSMIGERDGKMPSMICLLGVSEDHRIIGAAYTNPKLLLDNPEIEGFWNHVEKNNDAYVQAFSLVTGNMDFNLDIPDHARLAALLRSSDPGNENIIQDADVLIGKSRLWVYLPADVIDANVTRLKIEFEEEMEVPEAWEIIIREVYDDSGKVILKQLHGGFSAKTFQVASFDKAGRRMLPTVLKMGKVGIVEREERSYHEYVEKFILNNSTTIMGAHYSGEWGGVRYNFLGINGPETKLKWLTHVYKERPTEALIPLFDRIFKTVLKPWYGQPRLENIRLWESHSPLVPFFPNLLQDAERVLGISPDQETLDCPFLGRKVLNPYWFLKYEWPKRLSESRLWYSSICHGDLNMQNILLDETDNIYIIDFSETHPRNMVSDFARLEPIFKIEMTRVGSDEDLRDKLLMEEALTSISRLTDRPPFTYTGDDPMVMKAYEMVLKMREYARMTMIFEEDPLPYWLAVLEWTLPYPSYWSVPEKMKWHAVYSSGLILEKIIGKLP